MAPGPVPPRRSRHGGLPPGVTQWAPPRRSSPGSSTGEPSRAGSSEPSLEDPSPGQRGHHLAGASPLTGLLGAPVAGGAPGSLTDRSLFGGSVPGVSRRRVLESFFSEEPSILPSTRSLHGSSFPEEPPRRAAPRGLPPGLSGVRRECPSKGLHPAFSPWEAIPCGGSSEPLFWDDLSGWAPEPLSGGWPGRSLVGEHLLPGSSEPD